MRNQEVFDKVAHHLRAQGRKSYSLGVGCMYRCQGMKCAVGVLIEDEHYHPDMEGKSPMELWRDHGVLGGMELQLLTDLQMLHDDADIEVDVRGQHIFDMECLELRMRNVARRWNLVVPAEAEQS